MSKRTRRTIIVQLQGGLGDQLKRYYAGKYFASKLGAKLILNTSALTSYHKGEQTSLRFLMDHEDFSDEQIDRNDMRLKINGFINSRLALNSRANGLFLRFVDFLFGHISDIRPLSYDTMPFGSTTVSFRCLKIHKVLVLSGYFPSAEYFLSLDPKERELQRFDEKANSLLHSLDPALSEVFRGLIQNSSSFGIAHFRLGDIYTTYTDIGMLSEQYYMAAISLIKSMASNIKVFGLSDDVKRARELYPNVEVEWLEASDLWDADAIALVIMSAAAIVIGNSGLSTFAALLANRNSIKVAPLIEDDKPWRIHRAVFSHKNWFFIETQL